MRTDATRRRRAACRILLFVFALVPTHKSVLAAESPAPFELSAAQRAAIARAFAPVLVFHPLEDYFLTSSMSKAAAEPDSNGEGAAPAASSPIERWRVRVERYRSLSLAGKIQQASLGYRVFPRVQHGRVEVVVEYWCYYVYNAFTVRGGWLPYRVSDNHPHDLERLYVVLTPTRVATVGDEGADEVWARGAFRIKRVIANAHDGSIPLNEYEVRAGEDLVPPLTILVERGSHAMAPDLDHDGRFTPGIDSTAILKLQWGIRDRGSTWGRYRASFMDDRDESSVRLCGSASAGREAGESCARYALYPVDDLQRWFSGFQLSSRDRRDVIGRTPLLIRTFGDIRVEKLMVPTDPPEGRMLDRMMNRRTRTEAGFVAGFTTVAHAPALIIGRRYFWDVPSRYAPDIAAEAVALFPKGGRRVVETSVWSSYSVDAITNMLFGVGWFSTGPGADVVAGTDLRIGRFRVRPTWRLRAGVFDTRVTTTF